MKVAILSESPADEAAFRILIDGILGEPTQAETLVRAPRGWTSVFQLLPITLKHLYYRTDADALVIVVDSDNTPVHEQAHEQPDSSVDKCRVCWVQKTIQQVQKHLATTPNRAPLKTAVGLAVPAIEAWYRCGIDAHITEAMLRPRLGAATNEIKKQLKHDVYGIEAPGLVLETECAVKEATRLAQNLDMLVQLFPNGFGALARDVRS